MRTRLQTLMSTCILFLVGACAPQVWSQELRIETDVYADSEEKSRSHSVTLFDSGTVYDFVDKPASITVFRPPTHSRAGQFVLLDIETQRRTEVSTDRIEGLMEKFSKWAAKHKDPMLQFSANPEFEETFDEASGALTLKHPLWDYRVATIPVENKASLEHYIEFTDWYSRLSTMLHGALPPGPRLKLNAALEKHGVVPVEVRRKVESAPSQLRATHLFSWRLSREDHVRLEEARKYLASFEKVDNKVFLSQRADKEVVRGQSK